MKTASPQIVRPFADVAASTGAEFERCQRPAGVTDEEIICAWMEPRPRMGKYACPRWWDLVAGCEGWTPVVLDLDALWEVEERLTKQQWSAYRREFRGRVERADGSHPKSEWVRAALHATPEQKIRALAAVLKTATAEMQPAEPPDGGAASNNKATE